MITMNHEYIDGKIQAHAKGRYKVGTERLKPHHRLDMANTDDSWIEGRLITDHEGTLYFVAKGEPDHQQRPLVQGQMARYYLKIS
jgi:hypothetical protein